MGLVPTFSMADVQNKMDKAKQRFESTIIERLHYLGLECVNIARTKGTYTDQTSNLRSSIGYIILKDGIIISTGGFEQIKSNQTGIRRKNGTLDKRYKANRGVQTAKEGSEIGKELAEKLASNYSEGFVLIVVAGMDYAAAVEAKGYDVLTSSEEFAKSEIPKILEKLKKQMERRK